MPHLSDSVLFYPDKAMKKFILISMVAFAALMVRSAQAADFILYNPAYGVYLTATPGSAGVTTVSSEATVFSLAQSTAGSTTTLAFVSDGQTYYLGQSGWAVYGNVSNSTSASSRTWTIYEENGYLNFGNRNGGVANRYLCATASGVDFPYWSSSSANRRRWELLTPTPAALVVNAAAGYGTFVAPYDVALPDGVTAYVVDEVEESGKLVMTAVSGTLQAGTAVVTASEAGVSHTYQGVGTITGASSTTGLLTGVYADTQAPVGKFVLQRQSGKVGFYPVVGTQPTVKANRCYLSAPAGAGVKSFLLTGDTATGLTAVEALVDGTAGIYDLQGRRLARLQKGVNVVNGRKVLVK